MPIMLLRNLNSARGLANGTRLIVRGVSRRVIDAEVATGSHVHVGRRVFIPRVTLTPSEDGLRMPFKLKRRQFPVRLAFAMTINKAQGADHAAHGALPSYPCILAWPALCCTIACGFSTASLGPWPGWRAPFCSAHPERRVQGGVQVMMATVVCTSLYHIVHILYITVYIL